MGVDWIKYSSWKWLEKQVWNPNFLPSILLAQAWSQWVIGHFGNLVASSTTSMLNIFENSSWNYVNNCHEVRSKSFLNLGKISLSFQVSWTCIHKIINWYTCIYRRSCVIQCFIYHWDLQLSCWKFPLNHLASW